MSRLKSKQVDAACQLAWNWKPGEGQRLLDMFGARRLEWALNQRGVYWYPAEKCWRFRTESEKGAA